jgi:hypothetical protein
VPKNVTIWQKNLLSNKADLPIVRLNAPFSVALVNEFHLAKCTENEINLNIAGGT